jgi:hypothetical protein
MGHEKVCISSTKALFYQELRYIVRLKIKLTKIEKNGNFQKWILTEIGASDTATCFQVISQAA